MNTASSNKSQISVNLPVRAEEDVLILSDFAVEFKKIRPVGEKNRYYLIELPRIFLNGHYNERKRYCVKLAYSKSNNHRLIIVDLDDSQDLFSVNNRAKKAVKSFNTTEVE